MTAAFLAHYSDTRIFVLSALGSLILHGVLMAGLAFLPKSTIMKDIPPTVQLTLLPAQDVIATSQSSKPPIQPRIAKSHTSSPPLPIRQNRKQPLASPLQAILTRSPPRKSLPLTPPMPAKSILQDAQASQALKARSLMKMRMPSHAQQPPASVPTVKPSTPIENHILPTITSRRSTHSTARTLPTLPILTTPQTLTAKPPAQTGSKVTRPTIISSSKPLYPRLARESGWEGTVIVRTLIDTNGVPSQVKIRQSCGHPTLDKAGQDAVRSWTFQPAKDGNIPIKKWVDIPIKFDLNS